MPPKSNAAQKTAGDEGIKPEAGDDFSAVIKKEGDGPSRKRGKNWTEKEIPLLVEAGLSINMDPKFGSDSKLKWVNCLHLIPHFEI